VNNPALAQTGRFLVFTPQYNHDICTNMWFKTQIDDNQKDHKIKKQTDDNQKDQKTPQPLRISYPPLQF